MAVNLFNEYPQNTQAPSEDYPFGAFRNRTAPTATDGTTLEEKWSNDWQAFFSRLFIEASMTPSGEVDTVKVSQYYDALLEIIQREKVEVSNALNGTRTDVAASEDALRRTHELASSKVSKSGDTMTGGLTIQNMLPRIDLINTSIPHNNVGHNVILTNNSGTPSLSITNSTWTGGFLQNFQRKSGTVALLSDGIGVGQQWVDMTPQREAGFDYVNNTGKGIFVSISIKDHPGNLGHGRFIFRVDGIEIMDYIYEIGGTFGETGNMIFVPAGSSYHLGTEALGGVKRWVELR